MFTVQISGFTRIEEIVKRPTLFTLTYGPIQLITNVFSRWHMRNLLYLASLRRELEHSPSARRHYVVRSLPNIPELITILTFFLAISMGQNLDCAAVAKPNNVPG